MKRKKKKEKTKSLTIWYVFIALVFLCLFLFIGFCLYIYSSAPEFNKSLLYKQESSNLFDSDGNLITSIGTEKRQLVSYDDLPNVLIDSILATEDSRFYMNKGFDLPRFIKAGFGFITGEKAGGASTLGMQISKNTFTSTEASGFDGIVRKFTDIYISVFKLNSEYSKKELIEFYVNAPYLGSGSYGVEQACKTYFGKHVSDINLVEASIIAGLFQAPGEYDPFINPEKANERKNIVLDLMLRHGYITIIENKIAKSINVEDVLITNSKNISPYQGFIDTVVQEVIDRTGNNPYEVSMDIYTTMIRGKQDVINDFYNRYGFKDAYVQVGIGAIDNRTGAIIAVGAGRNKVSEMSFNYATQIKRHPGSTAKPLFDYGPGIEYNNWTTATTFVDKPVRYTGGGVMKNVDNKYQGTLSLQQCLVRSRNTCALQAFKKVNNSKINDFVTSLGITPEYLNPNSTYINEAHSIGGFTGVNPVQLAGSYAAFGNNGVYNEPHSYTKIVYKMEYGDLEEELEYESRRAMKETTAYMISYMLKTATNSRARIKNTEIATKTGTSSYDERALKNLGLSSKVIQDSWTVTYTSDYSIAIWYGYDKLSRNYYNTTNHAMSERYIIQGWIVKGIMNYGAKFNKPSGIIKVYRNGYSGIGAKK